MEISEQPTLAGFEDESQFYPRAFPASQPPLPGSEGAALMTVGSGRQLSMLLDQSSQIGAFSRILLESSLWTSSEEYSYVWNRSDTRFALSAFQLTPLGLSTDDNGSSLSPTVRCCSGLRSSGCNRTELMNHWEPQRLWRTPNASDVTGGGQDGQKRLDAGHAMQLSDQIMNQKLWPTPTVPNGGRRNPEGTSITGKKPDGGKAQIDLREFAIRMLPTPTARDWKSSSHAKTADNSRPLSEVAGLSGSGSLNPRFVEKLMGFEIDHTALKRSATPSSRSRPIRSLRQSRKL
jgi:hypothetical protein